MVKSVPNTYRQEEEGHEKRPVELYHLWWGLTNWYYTSGDVEVDFDGNTYTPATIERGSVEFDTRLEVSTLKVTFARIHDPVIKFIAQNPVEIIWIEVFRAFRDQNPLTDVGVIFIGQIKNVGMKGLRGDATCVGFEYYLKQPIPIQRYGPQCNWTLFDERCTLDTSGFEITLPNCNVSSDKLTINHSGLGTFDDHYFTRGYLVWDFNKRMITSHVGHNVAVRYPILDLPNKATIQFFAGCDGEIETCRDKFNNVDFHGGHPYIPIDNPVVWD